MKMETKVTAENKFGQVLSCLRISKLNFLVKEKPYSAYVTVRKKFHKEIQGPHILVPPRSNLRVEFSSPQSSPKRGNICDCS